MRSLRQIAQIACLVLVVGAGGSVVARHWEMTPYATQFREIPNAPPSRQHWLGTDELGRDRFSRVLYGTQISLLLAPAAALLSVMMAALIGGFGGYRGGWLEHFAMTAADLFLSMPWLFLLLAARAILPLNISPLGSVAVTFLLLGLLGWASSARILCAATRNLRSSEFVLQARASGLHGLRLIGLHVLPNLKPLLVAQFWVSVPVFIISEANLGMLGLGIAEPMPSWGSLLRELEAFPSFTAEPWKFVPLFLLILVMSGFQSFASRQEIAL